jgi:DNA-binding NtrC family response regulator
MADVMLVDDDPSLLDLFEQMLGLYGHRVVHAAQGGREALGWLKAAKDLPDLLLLDQRMPEMTGLEMLALLPERAAGIPVILVTGDEAAQQQVKELRGVTMLVKPFTMQQLVAHVDRSLAGPAPASAGTAGAPA